MRVIVTLKEKEKERSCSICFDCDDSAYNLLITSFQMLCAGVHRQVIPLLAFHYYFRSLSSLFAFIWASNCSGPVQRCSLSSLHSPGRTLPLVNRHQPAPFILLCT